MLREFSQRRNEIDDALRELEDEIGRGAHPARVEHIVLRTRPAKTTRPADELVDGWRDRAAALGFGRDQLAACLDRALDLAETRPRRRCSRRSPHPTASAPTGRCSPAPTPSPRSPTTPSPTATASPSRSWSAPHGSSQLADEFLASRHVVALTDAEPLFTTVEMLGVQDRIAARFAKGLHRGAHLVPAAIVDPRSPATPTSPTSNASSSRAWCTSGHRFQAAIGRAGAGKTTTVAACADAWQAAGYRVVGAAVKGEAARTLAAATGIDCETVAWYLAHDDPQTAPLDARTVLVVDEASTLSDRDLDRSWPWPPTTGATLRLIGDPAQHGAIAAGGMFRVLCERHPAHTPELHHHPPTPGPPRPRRRRSPPRRAHRRRPRPPRRRRPPPRRRRRPHHVPPRPRPLVGRPPRPATTTPWSTGATPPAANSTASPTCSAKPTAKSAPRRSSPAATGASPSATASPPAPPTATSTPPATATPTSATAPSAPSSPSTPAPGRADDTITVDFDGIGTIDLPRGFFDHHRTAGRRRRGRHRPRLRPHQLRRPRLHPRRLHQPRRRHRHPRRDLRRHHPRPPRQPPLPHRRHATPSTAKPSPPSPRPPPTTPSPNGSTAPPAN